MTGKELRCDYREYETTLARSNIRLFHFRLSMSQSLQKCKSQHRFIQSLISERSILHCLVLVFDVTGWIKRTKLIWILVKLSFFTKHIQNKVQKKVAKPLTTHQSLYSLQTTNRLYFYYWYLRILPSALCERSSLQYSWLTIIYSKDKNKTLKTLDMFKVNLKWLSIL